MLIQRKFEAEFYKINKVNNNMYNFYLLIFNQCIILNFIIKLYKIYIFNYQIILIID